MAISVVMPALEMAQETGKLLAWRKKEGQATVKGEPLLEIETDKAVVEVEAAADGILAGVKSREGDVVAVGAVIAWILQPGEGLPAEALAAAVAAPSARASSAAVSAAAVSAEPTKVSGAGGDAGPKISPKARRLAKEHGVDISLLRATGPDGNISTEDVQAYIAGGGAAAGTQTGIAPEGGANALKASGETLSAIARIMAERTTQSWRSVPHFFVTREIDASGLLELRKSGGAGQASINDVLVGLVARALQKHPRLNASWTGDGIRENAEVNISVAMAVDDGVVAAVIRNANKLPLAEIAVERRELTERARAGKLRLADISGGTFTVSNLGMFEVDAFTAIITPPQAAILAVGKIVERVVVSEGQMAIRPMITVTLSSDHRVVDGARAAQFLNTLATAMVKPASWIL